MRFEDGCRSQLSVDQTITTEHGHPGVVVRVLTISTTPYDSTYDRPAHGARAHPRCTQSLEFACAHELCCESVEPPAVERLNAHYLKKTPNGLSDVFRGLN